jgi:hypothetical protein
MARENTNVDPFIIKDCTLIAIATGKRAGNLRELRALLGDIDLASIYYHFWGGLLRPRFDDPEYHNDFAIWVRHALHDKVLAERLSLIDPNDFSNLESLRQELLEIIEERLDEIDYSPSAPRDHQFEFIRSQIVIFDTRKVVKQPKEFVKALPQMSVGSIFFHFIDARRRNPGALDDFRNWLNNFAQEYKDLHVVIGEIDPYFSSLSELRDELTIAFTNSFSEHKKPRSIHASPESKNE